jgi:DNA replicative helicase MCM subunit Mcm2 (Cdc46/Mcm family)
MENIKISNAILSRFDLVFLLLDDPDLQRDKKLSEHVMKLHSRNRKRKLDQFLGGSGTSEAAPAYSMSFNDDTAASLASKRLKPNAFGIASQMINDDDDDIEIISSTQDGQ